MSEITRQDYERMLDSHDWYYYMSDDGRVYRAGLASYKLLVSLSKTHPMFAVMLDEKEEQMMSVIR